MKYRKTLAAVAAAALVMLTPGLAGAESNGTPQKPVHRLHIAAYNGTTLEPSVCSNIHWRDVGTNGDDSPIDINDRALVSNICAGDFAELYSDASVNNLSGRPARYIKNLSFDFDTNYHHSGGAPRISVVFLNGDVAYLAASGCSNPIGVSSHWARADFTGALTNCSITVSGATGGTYSADGTRSAWRVYTNAHPNQLMSYTFAVLDEEGNYRFDRLALGTNRLYNYSNWRAVSCFGHEARC